MHNKSIRATNGITGQNSTEANCVIRRADPKSLPARLHSTAAAELLDALRRVPTYRTPHHTTPITSDTLPECPQKRPQRAASSADSARLKAYDQAHWAGTDLRKKVPKNREITQQKSKFCWPDASPCLHALCNGACSESEPAAAVGVFLPLGITLYPINTAPGRRPAAWGQEAPAAELKCCLRISTT